MKFTGFYSVTLTLREGNERKGGGRERVKEEEGGREVDERWATPVKSVKPMARNVATPVYDNLGVYRNSFTGFL